MTAAVTVNKVLDENDQLDIDDRNYIHKYYPADLLKRNVLSSHNERGKRKKIIPRVWCDPVLYTIF